MDGLFLLGAGLAMGLLGGMMGIGGSVILIPVLFFAFGLGAGENQHLYQAAAMICNFFVALSAVLVHHKARLMVPWVLKRLVPAALIGIVAGVAWSNSAMFTGNRSYLLSRVFGGFLVYVALYNGYRLIREIYHQTEMFEPPEPAFHRGLLSMLIGMITGLAAGLMGIGAGTVVIPLQQLMLKMPLRRAIGNSAATIVSVSWIGALFKNATLGQHHIVFTALGSGPVYLLGVKIAALVAPTAILGGFVGGRLMHKLPIHWVRAVFITVVVVAAIRLLSVGPST